MKNRPKKSQIKLLVWNKKLLCAAISKYCLLRRLAGIPIRYPFADGGKYFIYKKNRTLLCNARIWNIQIGINTS